MCFVDSNVTNPECAFVIILTHQRIWYRLLSVGDVVILCGSGLHHSWFPQCLLSMLEKTSRGMFHAVFRSDGIPPRLKEVSDLSRDKEGRKGKNRVVERRRQGRETMMYLIFLAKDWLTSVNGTF